MAAQQAGRAAGRTRRLKSPRRYPRHACRLQSASRSSRSNKAASAPRVDRDGSLFICAPFQFTFDPTRYQAPERVLKGQRGAERSRRAERTVTVYDLSRRKLPAADAVVRGAFLQVGKQSSCSAELSLRAGVLTGWLVNTATGRSSR